MPDDPEIGAVAQGRGKWGRKGVPHRGWTCVSIEDREEPIDVCEMCESQEIRYVHHMEHPDYPAGLAVGCVCAGHMEGDLIGARRRDDTMRGRAAKRRRWLQRIWKMSERGNEWIEADGYRVTVYPLSGGSWGAIVVSIDGMFERKSRRFYATADAVKLAAFDVITARLAMDVPR